MPIDDATWAQVHAAYIANEISTSAICKKFNLSSGSLYSRRVKEGWPLRGTQPAGLTAKGKRAKAESLPATASLDDPPQPKSTAKSHAHISRAARASLILRLYNAIDLKLTQMEKLMSEPEATKDTSSADHERETRTITGLVRNFERVTEMDADLTKPAGKFSAAKSTRAGTASSTDAASTSGHGPAALTTAAALAADPARAMLLRRDIAQRLERIMGKGNPPGDVGGTA